MLGAFILGSTKALTDYLYWATVGCQDVSIQKVFDSPPTLHYLIRLLNVYSPQLVFIEIGSPEGMLRTARDSHAVRPDAALVGYAREISEETLKAAAQAGIGEVLRAPFDERAVKEAIARALDTATSTGQHHIVAFQPARGGSGATKTALNVAWSLANHWRQRVLLIDADLHSGPLGILFGARRGGTVADALDKSSFLRQDLWGELVTKSHGFDLLPSPPTTLEAHFSPWDCHRLLGFVLSLYDRIVVDLPDALSESWEAVIKRANRHYVVCNPDQVSLALARRRLSELEERGADPSSLDVLVNRYRAGGLTVGEIEASLDRPVCLVLPTEAQTLPQLTVDTELAGAETRLGRRYRSLAQLIAGVDYPKSRGRQAIEKVPLGRSLSRWFDWSFGKAHN